MSIVQGQVQDHKYLVCAIYSSSSQYDLTEVIPVKILLASSPFGAIAVASRSHNPDRGKPIKYVASRILGPFRVNMFSNQTFTCEELIH